MATLEGTRQYFNRLAHKNTPPHSIRTLGKTMFKVSSIGFGGYRIHHNSIEHARALRYALLNGFNLIDTSSNYTNGGSEMLIGSLLQEMFERQEISRDEVIIVSKVGYVQGQNLELAQKNEADGRAFPEMVKYMQGCWHCIHPDFLEDQLSRSLERLQQSHIDVYLLHNPEYFLADAKKKNGTDIESTRAEYYRRIGKAFEWLEDKVAEGKIKAYGISSNTFPSPTVDPEFTSLEKVIEIATTISAEHYFQVIQFPFNLYEGGACLERNQNRDSKTLLEIAIENELGTLVNRPLNAMAGNSMIRLASFRKSPSTEIENEFSKYLASLQKLESEFQKKFSNDFHNDVPQDKLQRIFSLSTQLRNGLKAFQNWEHWDHVKQNVIVPQSLSYLSYFNNKKENDKAWKSWSSSYAQCLDAFLDTISKQYENQAQQRSLRISQELEKQNSNLANTETLSQKTLQILTSVKGIDCVLLGMRRLPYVEDAYAAWHHPAIEDAENLLANFGKFRPQD